MGTEILRPQDCLIERIRVPPAGLYSRRRNYGYFNPNYSSNSNTRPNWKPAVRHEKPDQRRQRAQSEPSMSKRSTSVSDDSKMMIKRSNSDDRKTVRSSENKNDLLAEKVMILRRGESLDSKIKKEGTVAPRRMTGKCDVYAGSAFAVSPEPSSLPLPSFFKKQISVDDSATRDIKRLLRLEL
ncbi:uncharacterized protein LOC116109960 [Pistacia vera]|uniref:uncharacterized protein LOC116109960 n=1 Tax=Pistacia vera TaxID=55513 RepID=UPI001263032C|nr:uncharacterized protein LOC116109960 [Pistacia vera]